MAYYNQIFVMCNQDLTFVITANSLEQAELHLQSETNDVLYCIAHYFLPEPSMYECSMYRH